jgi:leader peptidase (prepilin peptidase)/N-methyltransferase
MQPEEIISLVFIIGIGACTGSFLNVCILRIPLDRSVIYPGSQCGCGKNIPFYHNIPVLSWIILRGKSTCCSTPFSIRYPIIELLTAILFWAVWEYTTSPLNYVGLIFTFILIAVTFIDLDHMIIPDRFSIGGAFLGLILSFCLPEIHGYSGVKVIHHFQSAFDSLLGILIGTAVCYWIATIFEIALQKPAMGEGDVKFLACVGAFCGWQGAVFSLFAGAVIGIILVLLVLLFKRTANTEAEDPMIPFGPMLAIAAWLHFMFLESWTEQYFANFESILVSF